MPPRDSPRPTRALEGRVVDVAFAVVAFSLLASMLAAALHDASRAWDVWSYHVPFAARLAGLLPESVYAFSPANQARFDGYPLLGELLQGWAFRLVGRVEATNLVAFASVPVLALALRARHGVAWPLTVIGALAIPLVHVHATSSYVDLPANVAATILVMEAIAAHATAEPVPRKALLVAGISAAFAVNAKFQLHPFVLVAGAAFAVRAVPAVLARRDPREIAAIVCALPLVFFRPLENLVVHHNPYYPVRLEAFGVVLPGPEAPYGASPRWLAASPRPVRFAASLVEIGLRPMSSTRRWTVDQWMPDGDDGARMGGFFHAYVVVLLALLAARGVFDRSRATRVTLIGFALLTALAAIVPQSHELRYYLVWMLVLVAVNLTLATRATTPLLGPRAIGMVSFAALVVVLAVTRGGYAYPSGSTAKELVAEAVDPAKLARVPEGGEVCVIDEPFDVLYASPFHPPRRYRVIEAAVPADCGGAPLLR